MSKNICNKENYYENWLEPQYVDATVVFLKNLGWAVTREVFRTFGRADIIATKGGTEIVIEVKADKRLHGNREGVEQLVAYTAKYPNSKRILITPSRTFHEKFLVLCRELGVTVVQATPQEDDTLEYKKIALPGGW